MTANNSVLPVLAAFALLTGCPNSASHTPEQNADRLYYCNGAGPHPPQKVIVPVSGGITGSWNVMLVETETDLEATAASLAFRYGGHVTMLFRSINAFNMALDDELAAQLALEAAVCYVEQDMVATGT